MCITDTEFGSVLPTLLQWICTSSRGRWCHLLIYILMMSLHRSSCVSSAVGEINNWNIQEGPDHSTWKPLRTITEEMVSHFTHSDLSCRSGDYNWWLPHHKHTFLITSLCTNFLFCFGCSSVRIFWKQGVKIFEQLVCCWQQILIFHLFKQTAHVLALVCSCQQFKK